MLKNNLEIQIKGEVKLGLLAKVAIFDSPRHVASDEISEYGSPQTKTNAANDGLFHLCHADVEIAVLVMGSEQGVVGVVRVPSRPGSADVAKSNDLEVLDKLHVDGSVKQIAEHWEAQLAV